MKYFIATKNKHKLSELERILKPLGIDVISEVDLDSPLPEIEETGTSFEENALLKAEAGFLATGLPSIADDSGLCVDFLDGAPGIFSARFAGEPTDNDKNNEKLLKLLEGVPYEKRSARFVSAVACVFSLDNSFTVRGECEGYIGLEKKGTNGFGYDPLFISELGCFGELTDEQKDSVSHRGKSLEKLYNKLSKILNEE